MKDVVILGAARTPVGSFNGSLSTVPCPKLGGIAIREAIKRSGVPDESIDEVIMGCVVPAGQGQAPARQALFAAGLKADVAAMTINKVCGSGLKSVGLAAQAIMTGDADVIVAGGMESMTLAPHVLHKSRAGYRMGNFTVVDSMVYDGLWNPYNDRHMGTFAEDTAEKYGITREELDAFTIDSYKRVLNAQEKGIFDEEIVPVEVPQRKGDPIVFDQDEEPKRANFDKIPKLKSAFREGGVVTAANASSINDGAAAVVVASAEKAEELGIEPMARIVGQATASQEPQWFTTAPVAAIRNLFEKTGLNKDDFDVFEVNEAFAVVSLYTMKELGLDPAKVDPHGGAVAIGHPIGCSGARILVTLLYQMKRQNAQRGLAALCIGGGEAFAMALEKK